MRSFLETKEDMKWLAEVHLPGANRFACAALDGNDDFPEEIKLWRENSVHHSPAQYKYDEDSDSYKCVNYGDTRDLYFEGLEVRVLQAGLVKSLVVYLPIFKGIKFHVDTMKLEKENGVRFSDGEGNLFPEWAERIDI